MTGDKMTLLFDLDNTLLDFDTAEAAALTRALGHFGIEATPARLALYNSINKRYWALLEDGTLTRREVLYGRFKAFFDEIGVQADYVAAQDMYEEGLCGGVYYVPGALELLEALYTEHDLYIISNGNAKVQDARLGSSGITRYFKNIFVSEKMGADKPSRRFFELCIAQIPGFDASRALIIGDSLTSDIRGGMNMGIATCWYNPKGLEAEGDIRPDYVIASLDALPALLRRLSN